MNISPTYNKYYAYSALYKDKQLVTYGACPLIWQDNVVLQGGKWKQGLTWADANYHLYENSGLSNDDAQFVEECIYTSLNESEETSGRIGIDGSNYYVRWCLLEEEQIDVIMNLS